MTVSSFALRFVAISALLTQNAQSEPLWGINVADAGAACELKTPIYPPRLPDHLGSLWVGFYLLAEEVAVPGYILPKGEVLTVIKVGPDFEAPSTYKEPLAIQISDVSLRKYKFEGALDPTFFFVQGLDSVKILEAAIRTGQLEFSLDFEHAKTLEFEISTGEETNFSIYAQMLEVCGRAIAS